jgi:hypothetical protein
MVTKCVPKVTEMACESKNLEMINISNFQKQQKLCLKLQCRFFYAGMPNICPILSPEWHVTEKIVSTKSVSLGENLRKTIYFSD